LDEPFTSKVNILGVPSMDDGCDTKRESKTGKMMDCLIILERIVEKMMNALCQHGEKVY